MCAGARGCSFLPPHGEGWNSFRGPTPSSPASSAVRLLRLSLPYSSELTATPDQPAINHLDPAAFFFFLDPPPTILHSRFSFRYVPTLSFAAPRRNPRCSATPSPFRRPPCKSILPGCRCPKIPAGSRLRRGADFLVKAPPARRR